MWQTFAASRNKLKDLQSAAETGKPAAVKNLMTLRPVTVAGQKEPVTELAFVAPYDAKTGFASGKDETILLDVIELYDIHFPFPR